MWFFSKTLCVLSSRTVKALDFPQIPVFPVEFLQLCVWLSVVCKGWAALTWGFHCLQFFKQNKIPQHCDFYHFLLYWVCGAAQSRSHRPQNTWELLDVSLDLGRELLGRVGFVTALSCWEQAGINPPMCAQILGGWAEPWLVRSEQCQILICVLVRSVEIGEENEFLKDDV